MSNGLPSFLQSVMARARGWRTQDFHSSINHLEADRSVACQSCALFDRHLGQEKPSLGSHTSNQPSLVADIHSPYISIICSTQGAVRGQVGYWASAGPGAFNDPGEGMRDHIIAPNLDSVAPSTLHPTPHTHTHALHFPTHTFYAPAALLLTRISTFPTHPPTRKPPRGRKTKTT